MGTTMGLVMGILGGEAVGQAVREETGQIMGIANIEKNNGYNCWKSSGVSSGRSSGEFIE